MYLSDRDIKSLLGEMDICTSEPTRPFNPIDQIQPCSVDLRLDGVFWQMRSRQVIDLRRSGLLELSPRRYWRRLDLRFNESIMLGPGEMVLGRTYEKFTVPLGYAGHLEGRSSFARLGLSVHCSGSFLNPGWRGHMPMQLVNHGKSPIRLVPFIPICQIMLGRLSSDSERVYGERELSSKYMEDDGGPSYWWRDKQIQSLQSVLSISEVDLHVQEELLRVLGPCSPDLIERFEMFVRVLPHDAVTNSTELLERFVNSEERLRLRERVLRDLMLGSAPGLIAVSLGSLFSQPFGWTTYGWLHYVLWAITLSSLPASYIGFKWEPTEYLTTKKLSEARRQAGVAH